MIAIASCGSRLLIPQKTVAVRHTNGMNRNHGTGRLAGTVVLPLPVGRENPGSSSRLRLAGYLPIWTVFSFPLPCPPALSPSFSLFLLSFDSRFAPQLPTYRRVFYILFYLSEPLERYLSGNTLPSESHLPSWVLFLGETIDHRTARGGTPGYWGTIEPVIRSEGYHLDG